MSVGEQEVRRIRTGGLFRCRIATIEEADELPTSPGTLLDCKYESPGNENLRLATDGVWEWNSPTKRFEG